jgi:hypothetical protein
MSDTYEWKHQLPTPRQREILVILMEEAAEVQQRASKLLRFGRDEIQEGHHLNNAQRLSLEIGDMAVLVQMAIDEGLVIPGDITARAARKREKLRKYMQGFSA